MLVGEVEMRSGGLCWLEVWEFRQSLLGAKLDAGEIW
jgi:hypothetical protein